MKHSDKEISRRLEELLGRAERYGRRMPLDELRELARTYRLCSARLAILRSRHSADPEEIRYLNALAVRAYSYLRVAPRRRLSLRRFFMSDFPATLAATARIQVLTALLMLSGGVLGATLVNGDPAAVYACIPAAMYPSQQLEQLVDSANERADFLAHKKIPFAIKSIFSASLFVHNLGVGIASFALGILAGVPTLLLVVYNGLTIGAFAWIFSRDPSWLAFWAWILPHAIPELLGVNLCSAGGLLIGRAVIAPGRAGTASALRNAAAPALELVAASIPLFIVAAGIESFLRQSELSTAARYAAAAAALACVLAYILYVRSESRRRPEADLSWLLKSGLPGELPDTGSAPAL